jgi:hypothetical protein
VLLRKLPRDVLRQGFGCGTSPFFFFFLSFFLSPVPLVSCCLADEDLWPSKPELPASKQAKMKDEDGV